MTEFQDVLRGRANIKRLDSRLLDKAAVAASLSADRQPGKTTRLQIEVVGATVSSGLVNIAGSTNEAFSFSGNGVQVSTKDFTSISGVTLSGISDGFIEIKAVSRSGQPVNQEISIYNNIAVRFFADQGRVTMKPSGEERITKYKFMAEPDKIIKENDIFYALSGVIAGITRASVEFVEAPRDFDGATHHIECGVEPL